MNQGPQFRWRRTIRKVLWTVGTIVALVVAISIVLGYVREWEWTGLVKDKAYTKRTLWDWLQLLIIPAVLAGVGLWFNRQQRAQELQTADRRAQDEALQAYLDQMSDLLIPTQDRPSFDDESARASLSTVARARTLTVLPRLAGDRKARVVQFLYESGLIAKGRPMVALAEADLRGADLSRANVGGANLRGANVGGADLSGADLRRADLFKATLREADLRGANLFEANLRLANLSEADLRGATLREADLRLAKVGGADLRRADLLKAYPFEADPFKAADPSEPAFEAEMLKVSRFEAGWGPRITNEQLEQLVNEHLEQQAKSLKGATMPNGQQYEDWLKSKGLEEDQ